MTSLRNLRIAFTIILFLGLFWTCSCFAEESASEIVASMLKSYGGADSVRKVASVTARGSITEFLNGNKGTYARYLEHPVKLRIEVMPEKRGEIRILNGRRGWQSFGDGFSPVSTFELQAMIYQYSYLDLPMGLTARDYRVEYAGMRQYKGRESHLLLIETNNSPQLRVYVDAKTHLIAGIAASFSMEMMSGEELSTEYSDFRPVEGVLFPHKLVNFAGDTKLSEILLDEIYVNRKISPQLFSPY
jgi:hypothetical protein